MKYKSVVYVDASEVFEGYSEVWQMFTESEPPCTWGDNDLSCIKASRLWKWILQIGRDDDGRLMSQFAQVAKNRLKELDNTLVNLEN